MNNKDNTINITIGNPTKNQFIPLKAIHLNLNDIESLGIDQTESGLVNYSIELNDESIFHTSEKDGLIVIEKLRERTAQEYAQKKKRKGGGTV